MTKKDYVALAGAIHRGWIEQRDDSPFKTQGERITAAIADALAADSPRFDRARFITACETGQDTPPKRKRIPLCARSMGCLCSIHARGAAVSALCDARE